MREDYNYDEFSFDDYDDDLFYGVDDEKPAESVPDYDEEILCIKAEPYIPEPNSIEDLTVDKAEFKNRVFENFTLVHYELCFVTFRNCTFRNLGLFTGHAVLCKFDNCEFDCCGGEGYGFINCEFNECKQTGRENIDDSYYFKNCKHTNCTCEYDDPNQTEEK